MTNYVHDTTLEFDYDDERRARIVERSIAPEVGEIGSDRSVTAVARDGALVRVVVRAKDLVALRAGLNTWLSLVKVTEESILIGEN